MKSKSHYGEAAGPREWRPGGKDGGDKCSAGPSSLCSSTDSYGGLRGIAVLGEENLRARKGFGDHPHLHSHCYRLLSSYYVPVTESSQQS